MSEEEENYWHLDKRVPITLIITLLVQTGMVIWAMSALWARVDTNTETIARLTSAARIQDERVRLNTNTLSRVDETLRQLENTLERIDKSLDKIESRQ